jgi:NAD-dependent SIR2 family protein deacetylase
MEMSSTLHFPPNLVNALRIANNLAALTGAGISAESGLQTFREAESFSVETAPQNVEVLRIKERF